MKISQINITRPSDISRYLFTIAAMISVPPVLPLADSPSPTPVPQKAAPMTLAMNGWLWSNATPRRFCVASDVRNVRTKMAKIVLMQNLSPKMRRANIIKIALMMKYETST